MKSLHAALLSLAAGLGTSAALAQSPPAAPVTLSKVADFAHQVTGVTVSPDGRIFVNFPRWTEDAPISVAELKNGALTPFPNEAWNSWRNARKDEVAAGAHFVCVQSVVSDAQGRLWILDAAAPAMAAVVKNGPKLVGVDLKTNSVAKTIAFDEAVAPQGSYLNDVRITPDGRMAIISDSGAKGALIVVDLVSGKARRLLDGHPSTQPDPTVTVTYEGKPLRRPDGRGVEFAADGIALSPDGATFYWQAIKGKTLYSLPTAALTSSMTAALTPNALTERRLAAKIAIVGDNGPADGLLISRSDGRMYLTSPQDDAIRVRDLSTKGGAPMIVIQDARLRWPDTFAEGPDGTIYVTTSHIQDSAFFKEGAPIVLRTELWSFKSRVHTQSGG